MVRYDSYMITFAEVPDEVSLSFAISGCKNNCKGCHSPHLRKNIGKNFCDNWYDLIKQNKEKITCLLLLGGDREENTDELKEILSYAKKQNLKTCLYSGDDKMNSTVKEILPLLDYVKIGSYKEHLGGLVSTTTNQKMFKVNNKQQLEDITNRFWKKGAR